MSALCITKAGFQLLLPTRVSIEFDLEKQTNSKQQPGNGVAHRWRHFSALKRMSLS